MRVTIIPSDQTIGVDGRFLRFEFTADPKLHALQWYDDHGELEFVDRRPNRPLTANDYQTEVKPFVDAWLAEAGRLDAPPPPPTPEEQQAAITEAIQNRLDDFARTRGYDNILGAITYAASTNEQFAAEGQYAIGARDETWLAAFAIFAAVAAGERDMPSLEDFLAELPALIWPARLPPGPGPADDVPALD